AFPLRAASIELCAVDAHIGTVRKILMDAACSRFDLVNNHSGIIASTDSDTVVDKRWLFHIMREMSNGADAVGGRIMTMGSLQDFMIYQQENEIYRNLVARVESIIDPQDHDPWPRHFQYYGANMAVKKSIYEAVGGIPALRYLEDNALHDALFRNDFKIRRSPDVIVTTSIRTEGRVEIGFSEQLKKWSCMYNSGIPQKVPSGLEVITLLNLRKRLRDCWLASKKNGIFNKEEVVSIAGDLMVDANWLSEEIDAAAYFGYLWLEADSRRARGKWQHTFHAEPIQSATQYLEIFIG
ncbi:MAG: hypothetical protein ABI151_01765, partial [Chitinophagaceae bacterium]